MQARGWLAASCVLGASFELQTLIPWSQFFDYFSASEFRAMGHNSEASSGSKNSYLAASYRSQFWLQNLRAAIVNNKRQTKTEAKTGLA